MGLPYFYRWLVDKYPKVVVNAVQVSDADDHHPPNGVFDNLYLDMNGIIHPCFHPEGTLLPPTSYDEVFVSIFEYIDRLFGMVRPRKLLYLAVDGVAPRAKMNRQRRRRFMNAKDAEFAEAEEMRLKREFEMKGKPVLPKRGTELWDSNVITPGTIFMEELSRALEYYIRLQLNSNPLWKDIKVILSGPNVPGEGEHKIMSFIRLQRNMPGYDPNTRHCLHGLDGDLVMLALSTHEIHFSILREDVSKQKPEIELPFMELSLSLGPKKDGESMTWFKNRNSGNPRTKPYQFLNIWTLREYLELEFTIEDPPCEIDLERIIDDFVFICFLTGNDYLPHIPSIEIHEGAIDMLMHVYKAEFKHMGGYIVDTTGLKERTSCIKAKRLEGFIQAVSKYDQKIFEKRERLRQTKLRRLLQEKADTTDMDFIGQTSSYANWEADQSICQSPDNLSNSLTDECTISGIKEDNSPPKIEEKNTCENTFENICENTREMMLLVKSILQDNNDLFKTGCIGTDRVKFYIPGVEDRYYGVKFVATTHQEIGYIRKHVVREFMKGMLWMLRYYYDGVCSWNWFYPFHYGPLASSMKSLSCSSAVFELGTPFKPFDQLMAVLPPQSFHALPKAYQKSLASNDLQEFYPTDYEDDMDGKRFRWQAIVKLPFIKEDILLLLTKALEEELTEEQHRRNSVGFDRIFTLDSNEFGKLICHLYQLENLTPENHSKMCRIQLESSNSKEIRGYLALDDKVLHCNFPSPVNGMEDIKDDHVVSAIYENPDHHDHHPRLLTGVEIPPKTVTLDDIELRPLWHEYPGSRPPVTPARSAIYENHDHHDHLPRLLTGVEIPQKTVTLEEIEPLPLWHEHPGSRPPVTPARTQHARRKYSSPTSPLPLEN